MALISIVAISTFSLTMTKEECVMFATVTGVIALVLAIAFLVIAIAGGCGEFLTEQDNREEE